jgi:hypothetical protein
LREIEAAAVGTGSNQSEDGFLERHALEFLTKIKELIQKGLTMERQLLRFLSLALLLTEVAASRC